MDETLNPISADDFCACLGTASAPLVLGVRRSAHFSARNRMIGTGGDQNVQ
jgi:hypothetical protein